MYKFVSSLVIFTILVASGETKFSLSDVNGGTPCIGCTLIVGLVEQLSIVYNTTVENSLYNFCKYFPAGIIRTACDQAVDAYAKVVIDGLYSNASPDAVCHTLKFCRTDPGQPECHIFPLKVAFFFLFQLILFKP